MIRITWHRYEAEGDSVWGLYTIQGKTYCAVRLGSWDFTLATLGQPVGERSFPYTQSLSFILVLPSAHPDMPQHLLHSRLFRYVILHANCYSQGRKKLRSPFHNSSPLTQYLVYTLFSVLSINLGNIALQNSFTLLIPNSDHRSREGRRGCRDGSLFYSCSPQRWKEKRNRSTRKANS